SGCAPAPPYSLFNLFCLWVRPGEALPLISSIVSPGAPRRSPTPSFHSSVPGAPRRSPTPIFLFCPWVRPGGSPYTRFQYSVPGAPLHLIYPFVCWCAPEQPYT
ncbi:hypothetical protein CDAR_78481, partial [Caerostris darwini]